MGYITFQIFNNRKTIKLPENIIREYELTVAPVNERRLEYLALTSGGNAQDSAEKLSNDICKGLKEEISFKKDSLEIAYQIKKDGEFQ